MGEGYKMRRNVKNQELGNSMKLDFDQVMFEFLGAFAKLAPLREVFDRSTAYIYTPPPEPCRLHHDWDR